MNKNAMMADLRKSKSLPYLFYRSSKKVDGKSLKTETTKSKNEEVKPHRIFSKAGDSIDNKLQRRNQFQSCVTLFTMRSKHNYSNRKQPEDNRPKSLCEFTDDLIPLLEKTSSVSSFGSVNNITEESVLESSLESIFDKTHIDAQNNTSIRLCNRKLKNYKHRPRSIAGWPEKSLSSIPENLRNSLLEQYSMNKSKSFECNEIFSSLENSINIEKGKLDVPKNSNDSLDENIVIPRRKNRTTGSIVNVNDSSTCVNEKSFTREQRRRLKQKMRDTHKCPQNSVFLGLF